MERSASDWTRRGLRLSMALNAAVVALFGCDGSVAPTADRGPVREQQVGEPEGGSLDDAALLDARAVDGTAPLDGRARDGSPSGPDGSPGGLDGSRLDAGIPDADRPADGSETDTAPPVPSGETLEETNGWGSSPVSTLAKSQEAFGLWSVQQLAALGRRMHRAHTNGLTPSGLSTATLQAMKSAGHGLMIKFNDEPGTSDAAFRNKIVSLLDAMKPYGVLRRVAGRNEWDLHGWTAAQAVAQQEKLFTYARQAIATIHVESAPVAASTGPKFQEALRLGLARWSTHIGIHVYDVGSYEYLANGAANPAWAGNVWDLMASSGHGLRPVVITEGGYNGRTMYPLWSAQARAKASLLQAMAYGHYAWWVNVIRIGATGIQYALCQNSSGDDNPIYNCPGSDLPPGEATGPRQHVYEAMRRYARNDAHRLSGFEGGFEQPQQPIGGSLKLYPWLVGFNPRQATGSGVDSPFPSWDRSSRVSEAGQARTGEGSWAMRAGGRNQLLRPLTGLVPDKTYRVSAWVKRQGAGATAKILMTGYDPNDGRKQVAATAEGASGTYVEVSLRFVPKRTMGVLILEHNGQGSAHWDDVSVTPEN